jgi:hypothetical protein
MPAHRLKQPTQSVQGSEFPGYTSVIHIQNMTRRRQTSANLICVCMYDCMYLSISEEADLGKLDLLDGGHLLLLKLVKRYQHCCAIVSIIPHDCLCVSVCAWVGVVVWVWVWVWVGVGVHAHLCVCAYVRSCMLCACVCARVCGCVCGCVCVCVCVCVCKCVCA